MTEQAYEYWLNSIPGIGWKTIRMLLDRFGSPKEIYLAAEGPLEKLLITKQLNALLELRRYWDVQGEYDKLQQGKIGFLPITSDQYPQGLKEIPDPPYGLFYKGKLPENDVLTVAVIGARECSEYGRYIARILGKTFAESGVQVISGMARGIDGISQMEVLEKGGVSFGVLGCGVDICYPAQNRALYEALLVKGGVLSQYPPGTEPKPSLFPPRNRIVSGLADAVIVVEARRRSGTLITVDMALEQGREVYAVPGRLTDRLSDGCNHLIRQGAGIITSAEGFLQELKELYPKKKTLNGTIEPAGVMDSAKEVVKNEEQRNLLETQLLSCLDFYPRSVDQIRNSLSTPPDYQTALKTLMKLCLMGDALQVGNGYFQKGR